MKEVFGFQTYGKLNLIERTILELKNRFKINPLTQNLLGEKVKCYVPKLNKIRFTLGMLGVIVCVITPLITLLSIPLLLWSIK